jgi:puromycin-sensitive aminopeptidase
VPDQDGFRLPRHAWPRRYELELRPDLDRSRFDGKVGIDVDVREASDRLVLHSVELELGTVELTAADGTVSVPDVSFDEADQMAILAFDRAITPGSYRLTIEFTGILRDQLRGFYRSTFRDDSGAERVIATTQFEAADARRAFPCFDEPEFKATFALTLVVDENLAAVANGALAERRPRGDGTVEIRFSETMPMSTYLVAFVIGPFELTDPIDVDGVPLRIAAVTGKLDLCGYAVDAARHALTFLTDYFGIPYPGGKLDHVAVPDFAFGAMENLGCVTYRESLLLVHPAAAAQTELQRIVAVVAHETAHMWFGDLVTMKWWNGIWLNEAFATFMEVTASDAYRPEWQVWAAFGAGKAAALGIDGLRATRPVEYAVGRPEEVDGMFDVLTYEKGGSVLRMLEQYLGPEVFRRGISHYLKSHAYGNTETADLWDALESVSGEPVRTIMSSWIYQRGYPVIEAALDDDGATLVLRQRRFLYSGPAAVPAPADAPAGGDGGSTGEPRWAVPVNLRASVAGEVRHERLLLDGEEVRLSFPGPADWVVVNEGAWGFYRVAYSPELRDRLLAAGPAQVVDPLERLQLLGDAWAAVVAGTGALEDWAAAARAIAAEPDPDVWTSLSGVLNALDLAGDDDDRAALARFAREIAGPAWAALGWDPVPGESDRTAIARGRVVRVLADFAGAEDVIAEARRRLAAHLEPGSGGRAGTAAASAAPPAGALSPDLIGAAAHIAVATGGPDDWEQVRAAYRAAERPQDRLRYLYALADASDPGARRQTLDMTIGPEMRSQDAPFVVGLALGRRGAAPAVWEWLEEHWDQVAERLTPALLLRTLEGTAAIVDPDLAARVRAFCKERHAAVSSIRLEQILERMDVHVVAAGRLRGRIAGALAGGS